MPGSHAFAVIIPHFNDTERLRRCLDALMPQVTDDIEVVVADNNSPTDLSEIASDFPGVRIVIETEKGAGPARNRGVAETTAPWLMFIDADCVPAPNWIATGRRIATLDTVIGGRVDLFDETLPPRSGAEAFETVFAFKMKSYLERGAFLGAGNLVTSRAVFDRVGGFRPAVSEDKDWSQRAAQAGFALAFEDDFAAAHPSRQDWPALRRKWRRLTSEGYLMDGHKAWPLWLLKALAMPASAVVHVPRILTHPALSPGEKWRAAKTLMRLRLARMVWMVRQILTGEA